MTDELGKIAALQKEQYIVFTEQELRMLHKLVDRAYRLSVEVGQEDLWVKDLEARLAAGIELPLDETQYREGLVALLPEHLQSAARRLIVYTGDEHVAVAIWCEEDVVARAKERGIMLTRQQVQDIVDELDTRQDAEYGITWGSIDYWLDELLIQGKAEEKEEEEE